MVGRPKEHDDTTREALRVAAEELFELAGADGVSVRAVADAAGTTTRAVYSLFGSRDALLNDALAQKAYEVLADALDAMDDSDDPAADLVETGVLVFRRFVTEHPALYRIAFQRALPGFAPGPELQNARNAAFGRLVAKVHRLEEARQLGKKPLYEAVMEFQAMCEGLANFELRGAHIPMLPAGDEADAWRRAFTTLVRGWKSRASTS